MSVCVSVCAFVRVRACVCVCVCGCVDCRHCVQQSTSVGISTRWLVCQRSAFKHDSPLCCQHVVLTEHWLPTAAAADDDDDDDDDDDEDDDDDYDDDDDDYDDDDDDEDDDDDDDDDGTVLLIISGVGRNLQVIRQDQGPKGIEGFGEGVSPSD